MLKRFVFSVASLVLVVLALFAYLNMDKTQKFKDAAGILGRVEILSDTQTPVSDVRLIKLYNTRDESLVECWYRKPRTLSPHYRILLLYAGVKTESTVLELLPDRPDVVVCAVQYPYQRPRGILEHLRWPWTVRRSAYQVVGGGMLAATFLIDREKLASSQLTVVGASLGSFFGGIHGALDTRISKTLVVHGGGNFPVLVKGYRRFREKGHPVWLYTILADRLFGTFDPMRYVGRIAPRELVILATTNDKYFPPESAQSLYDRAGSPKKLFWMNTEHVRSKKSDVLDSILKSMNTYLFSDTEA